MLLPRFEYSAARTVEEALSLRAESPGAAYLAGGTDLLPQMRIGKRDPGRLIDIKRIEELASIRERTDGALAIGAAAPLAAIAANPLVRERYPLLAECCRRVGAWPLQNRATMAGNICNASPAADTAVALLALDAAVNARGPDVSRTIPITDFFTGPGQTSLLPGELVTEIVLPSASAGRRGTYLRLSRRRGMDLATVGVLVARSNGKNPGGHRVALASVAPTPLRVRESEACLDREGPAAAARAAEIAREACRPITDIRGTAAYRREMVGVLVRRAAAALI
ncbi:MAG: xanthine dehydrogenase family protein subunit M [Candidatus Eisenbacteria bacterium]